MRGAQVGMFILLILATPPRGLAAESRQGPPLAVTESQGPAPGVLLQRLPGLRHAFATARRELVAAFGDDARAGRMLESAGDREAALEELPLTRRAEEVARYSRAVGRWTEFQRLVDAVVGRPGAHRYLGYREVSTAFVADGLFPIPAGTDAFGRDRIVLVMAMSGYGPGLIADVVTGRLTIDVVQQAAKRRLLGHSDGEIARFLEAHVIARAPVQSREIAEKTFGTRQRFDDLVVHHARQRRVDPDLVRAVIKHESAWNPAARSHKGAIGLMQLMPETARLLGVDPVDPEQNIAGGIHYLADLRALFDGKLDAVIVAYVAGPTYAQRWLSGKTVLYHEVRAYLDNVKASYGRSGGRKD